VTTHSLEDKTVVCFVIP